MQGTEGGCRARTGKGKKDVATRRAEREREKKGKASGEQTVGCYRGGRRETWGKETEGPKGRAGQRRERKKTCWEEQGPGDATYSPACVCVLSSEREGKFVLNCRDGVSQDEKAQAPVLRARPKAKCR